MWIVRDTKYIVRFQLLESKVTGLVYVPLGGYPSGWMNFPSPPFGLAGTKSYSLDLTAKEGSTSSPVDTTLSL